MKFKRLLILLVIGLAVCLFAFSASSYLFEYRLYGTLPVFDPPKNIELVAANGGVLVSVEYHKPWGFAPIRFSIDQMPEYPYQNETSSVRVSPLGFEMSAYDERGASAVTNYQRKYSLVFPLIAMPVLMVLPLGFVWIRSRKFLTPGFDIPTRPAQS